MILSEYTDPQLSHGEAPEHLNISLAVFIYFFIFELDPIFLSLSIYQIDSDQNLINCFIMELLTSCLSGCSPPKDS